MCWDLNATHNSTAVEGSASAKSCSLVQIQREQALYHCCLPACLCTTAACLPAFVPLPSLPLYHCPACLCATAACLCTTAACLCTTAQPAFVPLQSLPSYHCCLPLRAYPASTWCNAFPSFGGFRASLDVEHLQTLFERPHIFGGPREHLQTNF